MYIQGFRHRLGSDLFWVKLEIKQVYEQGFLSFLSCWFDEKSYVSANGPWRDLTHLYDSQLNLSVQFGQMNVTIRSWWNHPPDGESTLLQEWKDDRCLKGCASGGDFINKENVVQGVIWEFWLHFRHRKHRGYNFEQNISISKTSGLHMIYRVFFWKFGM